ncbi:MAG: hypothetical protein ACXWWU_01430 [Candidatus Limnocylindria bacterium]
MTTDPLATSLLLSALLIATLLYGLLIRRRHATERGRNRSLRSIADNYGRSGLP